MIVDYAKNEVHPGPPGPLPPTPRLLACLLVTINNYYPILAAPH